MVVTTADCLKCGLHTSPSLQPECSSDGAVTCDLTDVKCGHHCLKCGLQPECSSDGAVTCDLIYQM